VRLEEASARSARARVGEIEAQLRRARALAEDDLATELEVEVLAAQHEAARAEAERVAAQVDLARAAVDERRSAVAKTVVRAPVAGRVGLRRAEVGMLADPSTLLFELGALDPVIVGHPSEGAASKSPHVRAGGSWVRTRRLRPGAGA